MTPEEFEKMAKDYAQNGLPEDSALICLHGGANNFGIIRGKGKHLAATIAMNMFADKNFARLVRLACLAYSTYEANGFQEEKEAAETVSKYLDRMGFKKEE